MRLVILIAGLFAALALLFFYIGAYDPAFWRASANGPMLVTSVLLGMIGDIIVIGFLLAYIIRNSEISRWNEISAEIDKRITEDIYHLITAEDAFADELIYLYREYEVFADEDSDFDDWNAIFLRSAKLLPLGGEIASIAGDVSRTIAMFPTQYAKNPKTYAMLGIAAAQISHQSVLRTQGLLLDSIRHLEKDDGEVQARLRELTGESRDLFAKFYTEIQEFYVVAIRQGFLAAERFNLFLVEEAADIYVKEYLLIKAMWAARDGQGERTEQQNAWASWIEDAYAKKIIRDEHIQAIIAPEGAPEEAAQWSVTLWSGTRREKTFRRAQEAG